jgi:peroxiredoxin
LTSGLPGAPGARRLLRNWRDFTIIKDRDVVFLGISMDSGSNAEKKVMKFAQKHDLTYLMLIDDGSASKSYQVTRIPTTYILDRDHIIKQILPGYLPSLGERISETIEKSL